MRSLLAPAVLAAFLGTSGSTAAAAPAPSPGGYSLAQALTLRSIAELQWSRDGRSLACVVSENDTAETSTNQDLWLWQEGADTLRRLTRNPKNDWSPTFSPGGDTIAFASARATGEDAKAAIYMLSLHGGEPWRFASYDESVGEVEWSPDGRWLAYVRSDTLPKNVREWRKKKWDQVVEDERLQYPHLWVVEVATGKTRRLTSGEQWSWNARWSPDSRSIAFLVGTTGKPDDSNLTDIGVVALAGGPIRKLNVIGNGSFAWSPDGRWIALATTSDRNKYVEKADLFVIPAAGGRAVNLTAGFDEDAQGPMWSRGSDSLFFHAEIGASTMVAAVARTGGPVALSTGRSAGRGGERSRGLDPVGRGRAGRGVDGRPRATHRAAGEPVERRGGGGAAGCCARPDLAEHRRRDGGRRAAAPPGSAGEPAAQ